MNSSSLWDSLLDLLFPPRPECPFCGAPGPGAKACNSCLSEISRYLQEPHCCRCGRLPGEKIALPAGGPHLCQECRGHDWPFILARASGPYEGLLKEAIHRFKYGGSRRLARPLASLMIEVVLSEALYQKIDLIVPVPLARDRLRRRGFNQAALLAKEIGFVLKIPVDERTLIKVIDTPAQTGLSRTARELNLINVFKVRDKRKFYGKNILIVDDVFTTGSTMSAVAVELRHSGAEQVYGLTVATGRYYQ